MSTLHYQALSGRRKRGTRSSPFVSAFALVAVAALLALVQSVGGGDLAESRAGAFTRDTARPRLATFDGRCFGAPAMTSAATPPAPARARCA
jgi:hypothetical protein